MQNEILLGRFHQVRAIRSNQDYVSVLNAHDVEFLVPIYSPPSLPIRIHGGFGSMTDPPPQGVLHLDHLEFHDVASIQISPTELLITTRSGHPAFVIGPQSAFYGPLADTATKLELNF